MSFPAYEEYKDSGVEWLGEVPEHWDVKRVKHLTSDIKAGPFGSSLTKDVYVESGYRVYGQEQVIPNDFTIGDYYIT
jgi:type I restriction enzyme S subunit